MKIPLIRIKETGFHRKIYFCGVQIYHKRKEPVSFFESFKKDFPGIKNSKVIVIPHANGEVVFYARTAKYWYKDDIKFFGHLSSHSDIFKMFAPEYPVLGTVRGDFYGKKEYDTNIFDQLLYTNDLMKKLDDHAIPFFKLWEQIIGVDLSKEKYKKATITDEIKNGFELKNKYLNIDLSKTILLIKNSNSVKPLPNEFWDNLEQKLKELGFNVFINSKILTIPECYYLASKSKAIIGMRCGLIDVLCELDIPQHYIYGINTFPKVCDYQVAYSFKDIPWASHNYITEYSVHKQTLDEISNSILEKIKDIK